jgi:hypothetical protein
MSFVRWALTILGFPLGGWAGVALAGPSLSPIAAAGAGAIAGVVIGAIQWAAVRPAIGWRWSVGTALGMGLGAAAAAALTGGATDRSALMVTGLITGAAVGIAQGFALGRGRAQVALWAATVSLSWALGWVTTSFVIVDAERGYPVFGLSGALLVTVITGLVLRRLLGARKAGPDSAADSKTRPVGVAR